MPPYLSTKTVLDLMTKGVRAFGLSKRISPIDSDLLAPVELSVLTTILILFVRMWIMQQEKVAGGDAPHLIIQLEDIEVSVVRRIHSENRPVEFLQLGKGRTCMLANPFDPFTIGF